MNTHFAGSSNSAKASILSVFLQRYPGPLVKPIVIIKALYSAVHSWLRVHSWHWHLTCSVRQKKLGLTLLLDALVHYPTFCVLLAAHFLVQIQINPSHLLILIGGVQALRITCRIAMTNTHTYNTMYVAMIIKLLKLSCYAHNL